MDFTKPSIHTPQSLPLFNDLSNHLTSIVKDYKVKDFIEYFKLSEKLALSSYTMFKKFVINPQLGTIGNCAFYCYKGEVFRSLKTSDYTQEDINFAQNHALIISGLYGLVRPLDQIQAYRLEIAQKIDIDTGNCLYQYWQQHINEQLNKLLKTNNCILNLASVEYSKVIDEKNLTKPFIYIDFRNENNGKLQSIPMYIKRARGLMMRYIIKNKIDVPEDLVYFDVENYKYSKQLSTPTKMTFIKKQ